MSWCLRKPRTRCSVHPLPYPVGLPERLRRRAICRSGINRANSRISAIVSSGRGRGCWMRPGQLEIGTQLHQLLSLPFAERWRLARDDSSDLAFYSVHGLQCLVPAALKLAGDQAIRGIDGVVLPTGMRGLVTRLLKRQLQLPLRGRCLARLSLDRLDGGIETERLQDAQNLRADGGVDAQAADRDTSRRAVVHAGAVAAIATELAAVGNMQLAAAMTTAQKPGQEQLSAPYRALDRGTAFTGCIVGDHVLVPLELVPGDVGLVMILDQNVPFGHRPMHATPDTLAAVLNTHPARRSPESIGARIDRIGQNVVHDIVGR